MKEVESFNTILHWLRYLLELRISGLYPVDEVQFDIYKCPVGFPQASIQSIDIDDPSELNTYISAAKVYQEKRKLFLSKIKDIKPGFYLNFISKEFIQNIVAQSMEDIEGIEVNVKDLFVQNFMDDNLKYEDEFYEDKNDEEMLINLIRSTNLYLRLSKFIFHDGLRTMQIKVIEYDGVLLFWEPSFTGDLILKNKNTVIEKMVNFILGMSYKDIIPLQNETEKLSVLH